MLPSPAFQSVCIQHDSPSRPSHVRCFFVFFFWLLRYKQHEPRRQWQPSSSSSSNTTRKPPSSLSLFLPLCPSLYLCCIQVRWETSKSVCLRRRRTATRRFFRWVELWAWHYSHTTPVNPEKRTGFRSHGGTSPWFTLPCFQPQNVLKNITRSQWFLQRITYTNPHSHKIKISAKNTQQVAVMWWGFNQCLNELGKFNSLPFLTERRRFWTQRKTPLCSADFHSNTRSTANRRRLCWSISGYHVHSCTIWDLDHCSGIQTDQLPHVRSRCTKGQSTDSPGVDSFDRSQYYFPPFIFIHLSLPVFGPSPEDTWSLWRVPAWAGTLKRIKAWGSFVLSHSRLFSPTI